MISYKWHYLGNYVISQWVGDIAIDTKLSCDQKLGYFTQDPGKHGSFMQDLGGRRKHWYFISKLNLARYHWIKSFLIDTICPCLWPPSDSHFLVTRCAPAFGCPQITRHCYSIVYKTFGSMTSHKGSMP